MKKTKKILSLLLVSAIALSAFAGCAGSGNATTPSGSSKPTATSAAEGDSATTPDENVKLEGYPIVNDKITIDMMGMKHPIHGEWSEMAFFKEMEELTNISFTYNTPMYEVFEEKKNLALNSGNYSEVLFGALLSRDQQVKYGAQGILIPLEDLIDQYCPNLTAMLDEFPHVRQSITAPDGHIYALPQYTTAPIAMTNAGWVNVNFMNATGMTETDLPKTTDGFYEMLVKFRDSDANGNGQADEIPLTLADASQTEKGDRVHLTLMQMFGIPFNANLVYADDNGQIQNVMGHANSKDYFTYANKLWTEKLLDNDAFTQGSADATAKGANNQVGLNYNAIPQVSYGDMSNEVAATYPALWAISTSESDPPLYIQENSGIQHGTFAITDKCTNVPAMMRWVDYLYSEEGSLLIHYGPKGMFYDQRENGLYYHMPLADGDNRSQEEFRGGDVTPDCGLPLPKYVRASTEGNWDDPMQQTRIKQVDEKIAPFMRLPLPDMYFTPEEQEKVDELRVDLGKYFRENAAKLVTGEMPIDQYDTVVAGLEKLRMSEYQALYQTAYDRWSASS